MKMAIPVAYRRPMMKNLLNEEIQQVVPWRMCNAAR